jgi:hypothetical protein
MTTLFLVWPEPSRRWWPVGRLTSERGWFAFAYTRGARLAEQAGFRPLVGFPDWGAVYVSETLFSLFANRLFPKGRSEYVALPRWAALPGPNPDPLVILARTLGSRVTDTFEVFAKPTPNEQRRYEATFFAHGLAYLRAEAREKAVLLKAGQRLVLEPDRSNPVDPEALRIRTDSGVHVGFVPRYLCHDIHVLRSGCLDAPQLTVHRANPEAPPQFLLLCTLTSCWPAGFEPCTGEEYWPANPDADRSIADLQGRAVFSGAR